MMKISKLAIKCALAAGCLFSGSTFANSSIVEVKASGLTKEVAIEQALVRAVSQVRGVDIKSITQRHGVQTKVNGKTASMVAIENATMMITQGQVTRYDVLSEECDEQNCEVTLNVEVPVYKSPGLSPNKRRKLVVVPFKGKYGKDLAKHLQTLLVQSRRFAVLDRELDHLYQKERQLLLSGDTAITEKMRLGQVLGLDYIIVGEVQVETDSDVKHISLTGETETNVNQYSVVNYKVINLATRQIKWQDEATLNGSVTELNTVKPMSALITSAIYPIKVVAANKQQLTLNQGGKSVEVGSIYDAFTLGEKLIDPYTKESLGREEFLVGQVKVTRVNSKVSYASVISGNRNKITKNAILRLAQPVEGVLYERSDLPVKSTVETSSAGGIILPGMKKKEIKPSPKGGVVIN